MHFALSQSSMHRDVTKTQNRLENGLVNGLEGTSVKMLFYCNRNLLNHS